MINIYLSLPFLELSSPFGTVISIIRAVIAIIRTVIPSNLSSRDARAKVVEGPGSLPAQLGFLVYLASWYTWLPGTPGTQIPRLALTAQARLGTALGMTNG